MKTALLVLLGLFSAGATATPEGVPKFPPNATHIEDYTVPGSATMQASFRLRSAYPDSGIIDHYAKGVSGEWAACKSRVKHGWQAYVDKSGKSPKLVHQHIRYWVNFDQAKMMTVIVRHYSKSGKLLCRPDNDVQHGVLVVSRSPELKKEIRLLKLSCGASAAFLPKIPEVPACSQ